MVPDSSDNRLTLLLSRAAGGDEEAGRAAFGEIYPRLQSLAEAQLRGRSPGETLQATALVHEVYLKLFGGRSEGWGSRGQFFAVAAKAMRHIAVDYARRNAAVKRGGAWKAITLNGLSTTEPMEAEALLDLDNALARLADLSSRQAQIVEMRFFARLSVEAAAKTLGISHRTAQLDWRAARAWLRAELGGAGP